MEKKVEIASAKKRRAKYLAEFLRTGWTKAKMGKKHGISPERMRQLLAKAKIENSSPLGKGN